MTAAPPDLAALTAGFQLAVRRFCAACASALDQLRAAFQRAINVFRRLWVPAPLSRLRCLRWTGIARRHAERPPTRGFWLWRCVCLACRERKGLT